MKLFEIITASAFLGAVLVIGKLPTNDKTPATTTPSNMTGPSTAGTSNSAQDTVPPQAQAVGYTENTFSSTFRQDIDLKNDLASGHNWYLEKFFGWPTTLASAVSTQKGGGVTLNEQHNTANYTIGSAAPNPKKLPQKWVGEAFGGGGYFEAVLKFDPATVMVPGAKGFPAWWLEPVEHMNVTDPIADQWPNQAKGYERFTEVDIFEYEPGNGPPNSYVGTTLDWSGIYNKTCPVQYCRVSSAEVTNYIVGTPPTTDFRQFHKFGLLWVPATDTTQGYIQYYFDGVATSDHFRWDKFRGEAPVSGKAPWTFSAVDGQHLVLILGTGNKQPMTVQSVNVWQRSTASNLKY